MTAKAIKPVRCAIYTRKSTEHGLEQEFNSLHAQREACEAYIKSQASQGWRALSAHYDDPAFSGGNMDRPALKRLLDEMNAGRVDVVVVYKIDRLTRSLADFAKLIEIFDARSISFVAVTQQFNTTTSMGRLTLNVLLSFAQFERELSSERVRDKVAASRRKGRWMGGNVPLGYDVRDKKLVINEAEAKTVRTIFSRYLAVGSLQRLVEDLDVRDIVSKRRSNGNNRKGGGSAFKYGSLAYLLKNRVYIGETGHKGAWFKGDHAAIVDRDTFDKAQNLIRTNSVERKATRSSDQALLTGLLYDDRGNRMTPSFSTKNGVRYRFYVSAALLRGRKADAGSITRVSATEIETLVMASLRKRVVLESEAEQSLPRNIVERITIGKGGLAISMKVGDKDLAMTDDASDGTDHGSSSDIFNVAWLPAKRRDLTRIHDGDDAPVREPNPRLVQAIVRGHAWHRRLLEGTVTVEGIAHAAGVHPKVVRNGIRLAFLPPWMTETILKGDDLVPYTIEALNEYLSLQWQMP